jgi:transglutaminase-like putative cysteine protease
MFEVKAPDVPFDQRPPRYYWRGRTYDTLIDGQWYTTDTLREEYTPTVVNPLNIAVQENPPARFVFNTGDERFSLLYSPAQPVWMSRPGITFSRPTETSKDIIAWHAYPALRGGETYQVDVLLNNPNIQQLREAGTEYPAWVTAKYLQLPQTVSPRIQQLAEDVTAEAETPFDKASAVTAYLRSNIEYVSTIPNPPRNRDTLEWILFDYKKGYCVYYASAEIMMLRSVGIPARMAVGFAQGDQTAGTGLSEEQIEDPGAKTYTVRRLHAHAWPEVYFPGIGWVEFEPTGSQPTLDRPLPPIETDENDLSNPFNATRTEDSETAANEEEVEDVTIPTPVAAPISPLLYVIPFVLLAAVLGFFINRRYPLATHVPVLIRASMERTGFEVPQWVYNWENWGHLSPIERSFESINFGLRTLDEAVPVHTTPVERARKLSAILPQMDAQIKTLLDEHQTSLYTSRVADVNQARRAAFDVRKQVIAERIRYLFYGKPLRS